MDKFSIFLQELKCLHELPKYDIAEYTETLPVKAVV